MRLTIKSKLNTLKKSYYITTPTNLKPKVLKNPFSFQVQYVSRFFFLRPFSLVKKETNNLLHYLILGTTENVRFCLVCCDYVPGHFYNCGETGCYL